MLRLVAMLAVLTLLAVGWTSGFVPAPTHTVNQIVAEGDNGCA